MLVVGNAPVVATLQRAHEFRDASERKKSATRGVDNWPRLRTMRRVDLVARIRKPRKIAMNVTEAAGSLATPPLDAGHLLRRHSAPDWHVGLRDRWDDASVARDLPWLFFRARGARSRNHRIKNEGASLL